MTAEAKFSCCIYIAQFLFNRITEIQAEAEKVEPLMDGFKIALSG